MLSLLRKTAGWAQTAGPRCCRHSHTHKHTHCPITHHPSAQRPRMSDRPQFEAVCSQRQVPAHNVTKIEWKQEEETLGSGSSEFRFESKNKIPWTSAQRGSSLSENMPRQKITQPISIHSSENTNNLKHFFLIAFPPLSLLLSLFHLYKATIEVTSRLLNLSICNTLHPPPPTHPCANHPHWYETSLCQIVSDSP